MQFFTLSLMLGGKRQQISHGDNCHKLNLLKLIGGTSTGVKGFGLGGLIAWLLVIKHTFLNKIL